MILTAVIAAAIYFIARAVALRARITAASATGVALAVALAFVAGSFSHTLGGTPLPSLPELGTNIAPAPQALGDAAIAALRPDLSVAALGSVDDIRVAGDRKTALVAGWVADPASKGPAHGVILILDGRERFDATPYYGQDRPDVARALSTGAAERTGFAGAPMALAGVPKGSHVVQCAAVTTDGRYELVGPTRSFTL